MLLFTIWLCGADKETTRRHDSDFWQPFPGWIFGVLEVTKRRIVKNPRGTLTVGASRRSAGAGSGRRHWEYILPRRRQFTNIISKPTHSVNASDSRAGLSHRRIGFFITKQPHWLYPIQSPLKEPTKKTNHVGVGLSSRWGNNPGCC